MLITVFFMAHIGRRSLSASRLHSTYPHQNNHPKNHLQSFIILLHITIWACLLYYVCKFVCVYMQIPSYTPIPTTPNPHPDRSHSPPSAPRKPMYYLLTMQSLRLAFPASLLQWPTSQGAAAVTVTTAAAGQARLHSVDHARVSQTAASICEHQCLPIIFPHFICIVWVCVFVYVCLFARYVLPQEKEREILFSCACCA